MKHKQPLKLSAVAILAGQILLAGLAFAPLASAGTCAVSSNGTGWEQGSCSFFCPAGSAVGVTATQNDDEWVHGTASCNGATAECGGTHTCTNVGRSLSGAAGLGSCRGEAYDWGFTDLSVTCWSVVNEGSPEAMADWAGALALTEPTCLSLQTDQALPEVPVTWSVVVLHAFSTPLSGMQAHALTWNSIGVCVEIPAFCTTHAWDMRLTTCSALA